MNSFISKRLSFFCTGILLFVILMHIPLLHADETRAKIHYLGHSAFVMQFDNDVTIVMDYGHYNAWVQWGWNSPIHDIGQLRPDIMTYSHHHEDHYDPDRIPKGVSHILTGMDSLEYNGISIKPIRTCEDNINIESNTSYLFTYKNLRILHLGDAQAQISHIKNQTVRDHIMQIIPDSLDLLFMTIEGKTQFIPQAEIFVDLLKPKRIIPMHHWSESYLQNFLDEIKHQNSLGKKYQILDIDTPEYILTDLEENDSIKVICPKREPFLQTGILNKKQQPSKFSLIKNYPNPFNPRTHIQFKLIKPDFVSLVIYNIHGQPIKILHKGFMPSGINEMELDARYELGKPFCSGLHFCAIIGSNFTQQQKMLLMK